MKLLKYFLLKFLLYHYPFCVHQDILRCEQGFSTGSTELLDPLQRLIVRSLGYYHVVLNRKILEGLTDDVADHLFHLDGRNHKILIRLDVAIDEARPRAGQYVGVPEMISA